MKQISILYPVFALVGWTIIMAVVMLRSAFKAVSEGLDRRYFRHGRGYKAPDYMISAYQHYTNLFEMPVLFYTAALVAYTTGIVSPLVLWFAWVFVLARIVHSMIHLKNSNVPRRRDSFLFSVAVLIGLWVILFAKLLAQ